MDAARPPAPSPTTRVTAIGGGTGLSSLLRGLKQYTDQITAIVTVADDGGSSGRLRKEFDIIPPGDIRSCLVALADAPELEGLFQYRFGPGSDLEGHAFGNLFIAVLSQLSGGIKQALAQASQILNVRGRVLPVTERKVALVADHPDGTKSTGEMTITSRGRPVVALSLKPDPGPADPEVLAAIAEADLIVLGPGSLYTSVIPPLLVPGMVDALRDAAAPKVYVCNVMTQPGETTGFSVTDHVGALTDHTAPGLVDVVVVNTGAVDERLQVRYAADGQHPVAFDSLAPVEGVAVIADDLVCLTEVVRHDPDRLARAVLGVVQSEHRQLSQRFRRITTGRWRPPSLPR